MKKKTYKENDCKVKKSNKKIITMIFVVLVIIIALLFDLFSVMDKKNEHPWKDGGKKVEDYTWKEFEKLTDEQKLAFSDEFTDNEFEEWMEKAKSSVRGKLPWKEDDKNPNEYTWEEFEKLTDEEKVLFSQEFEGNEFEEWMSKAEGTNSIEVPWKDGEKKPNEYTLKEFKKLTAEQQMVFADWFESEDKFNDWMKEAKEK